MARQGGQEAVGELGPEPGLGLPGPAGGDGAIPQGRAEALDGRPGLGNPHAFQGGAGLDLRRPAGGGGMQQAEGMLVIGRGPGGQLLQGAVGLVDQDQVGQLDDAPLDALQVIAAARQEHQEEHVGHIGDGGFRLADPHGLHQHDVMAGGLDHQHRFPGPPRHPAQGPAGGRGADEGLRLAGQPGHPGLVPQDRAAAQPRGGIHGQNRQPVAPGQDMQAEALDEGRFADAGRPGNADANRAAGTGQQDLQQAVGQGAMVGPVGFHQGDGLGQGPAVTSNQRLGQRGDIGEPRGGRKRSLAHDTAASCWASLSTAASCWRAHMAA